VTSPAPIGLGVVFDYPQEGWPSMDLVGEMILTHLAAGHAAEVNAQRVCPPYHHRFTRVSPRRGHNADRVLNRFWNYPRYLNRLVRSHQFDLFHIVDHSYAQLAHALPPGRAVVTCHDLVAFHCLLDPARNPRPRWFRAMAQRTLSGLQKAAAVICDSGPVRDELLARGLIVKDRLHVVPLAVRPECSPEPNASADAEAERLLGPLHADAPELLHVGSNVPRKRVDVVLDVFAAVRQKIAGARLIKVGGALEGDLARQSRDLGITDAITVTPFLTPDVLGAIYRRAALALQPSDLEGFGLPVVEALACGTPVLASDIAVLREVGGEAASYAPVGDVPAWSNAALKLLVERRDEPASGAARRAKALAHAAAFRWTAHVARLVEIYRAVLDGTAK
jgi:glycosyltransferase involved in cell wall biosynthesis